jgi:hypothetical protein
MICTAGQLRGYRGTANGGRLRSRAVPAAGGGAPFDASSVSGLQLDLDPSVGAYSDAGSTPAVDGDGVYQLNDQSGHSRNAVQTSASLRPIWRASRFGSRPGLEFDGSNDLLRVADSAALRLTSAQPLTVFVVYKRSETTSTSRGILDKLEGNPGFDGYGVYLSTHRPAIFVNGAAVNDDFTSGGGTASAAALLATWQLAMNGGHVKTWHNATNLIDTAETETSIGDTADVRVGIHNWASDQYFAGTIGRILFYNAALGSTDLAYVQSGLSATYGLGF